MECRNGNRTLYIGNGVIFGSCIWIKYTDDPIIIANYDAQSATISLCKMDTDTMNKIMTIAKENEEVKAYLDQYEDETPELNYILPTEWFAAEIPMNGVEYRAGHKSPEDYDKNQYKVIFIKPQLSIDRVTNGKEILWNLVKIQPVVEVRVSLEKNEVTDILDMPESVKYAGIPEAIY